MNTWALSTTKLVLDCDEHGMRITADPRSLEPGTLIERVARSWDEAREFGWVEPFEDES